MLATAEELQADEGRARENFWRKLRRVAGRIPFAEDLVAAYFCAVDPETPGRVKAVLMTAVAYFVLPADLIPDFILSLGFTDDAAVVLAAINAVSGHLKPRHRAKARAALELQPGRDAARPEG